MKKTWYSSSINNKLKQLSTNQKTYPNSDNYTILWVIFLCQFLVLGSVFQTGVDCCWNKTFSMWLWNVMPKVYFANQNVKQHPEFSPVFPLLSFRLQMQSIETCEYRWLNLSASCRQQHVDFINPKWKRQTNAACPCLQCQVYISFFFFFEMSSSKCLKSVHICWLPTSRWLSFRETWYSKSLPWVLFPQLLASFTCK